VDAIHSQKARTQDWSKDDYYEFIRILLREFEKGPARNIAVCLTKSDQDSMHGRSWDIFERRYDKRIRSLLEMYRIDPAQPENNIRKHNIEVFITSSAGYLYNLTTLKYEKNFINGVLLNPDDWNPYNATSPFFWIFEQIEKGRGQKGIFTSSPQDPTPYPIIVNT
jgi:hypothetical protein